METINKIIKLMLENKGSLTIRQISQKIKADYKITHTAVQRLIKKQILLTKTIGQSTLCELNSKYFGIEIYKAEQERKNQLLKNSDLKQLYKEIISKINTSFFIFLIFGSYANNRNTQNSDIDLLFISNKRSFEKKLHNILRLLPLKIHTLVFTEKQFKKMLETKKSNVVKEAIDNYIILYGIENFYQLKNA